MVQGVLIIVLVLSLYAHGICHAKVCNTENLDWIDYSNILKLKDCTKIVGDLLIFSVTFDGDKFLNLPGLHPYQLNVLQTVTEVTGVIVIQGEHQDFKDLSFLKNLTTLLGRNAYTKKYDELHGGAALSVSYTSIGGLNLPKLTEIRNGDVIIARNTNLCYANTINFKTLFQKDRQRATIKWNKSPAECALAGKRCSSVCDNGCWGPGRENCVGNITENNLVEDLKDLDKSF